MEKRYRNKIIIIKSNNTDDRDNDDDDDDNNIERLILNCFTISSLSRQLSPARTLAWPGRSRVKHRVLITSDMSHAKWCDFRHIQNHIYF